ncbi:sodium:solute symporter family protein [Haliangium ochraceum]|uniref:Na+/solute symporter n=1 Tax=Haliangium ochraceum (strain DSM 14365 / JCM 11303 / SMP-2) TaxID=502025 RepID=D0LHL7_HALO1|nr:sodium:solute symporter family protein [Haliangium ochraceum]ACY12879.1 Na+/solute symporter [Haliangium ochraceum DSM 14365]
MERWTIVTLICGAYLVASLVMGVLPGRKVTSGVSGFVAGDRAMNVVVLYFVMGASVFSSFAFLGGPGWAYGRGAAAFYILAYGVVGMVPLYFMGPRARRLGSRFGFVTQAELLAHRYQSRAISVLLAVLSIAAFVPYLTLQMKGAGYIVSVISEGRIEPWVGAAVAYAVVLVYVLASGVMGVGWTNTFQGIFMMAVAWFLGLYLPERLHGGIGEMFAAIEASERAAMLTAPGLDAAGQPWSWATYSSAVAISALGFCMWPHLFMKSYAAKSERALRLSAVLYTTFQAFLIPILFIGFAGVLAFPGVSPSDTILPHILTQVDLSPVLVGLVCAGTLAASMSSGDAILHAAASIGVRDGLRPFIGARLSDRGEANAIRALILVIAGVAYVFAVVVDVSIVALLLGAYGGVAQIFPPMFAAFYWPRATRAGAVAGLLGGLITSTLFLVMPEWRPWPIHEGAYGLLVNLLLLVSVSLATPPLPIAHLRAYMSR